MAPIGYILNDIKRINGCSFCQENEPLIIDFHHIDPKLKSFNVSDFRGKTIEEVVQEINKCACLCANCHRRIHLGLIREPFKKIRHPRLQSLKRFLEAVELNPNLVG